MLVAKLLPVCIYVHVDTGPGKWTHINGWHAGVLNSVHVANEVLLHSSLFCLLPLLRLFECVHQCTVSLAKVFHKPHQVVSRTLQKPKNQVI